MLSAFSPDTIIHRTTYRTLNLGPQWYLWNG